METQSLERITNLVLPNRYKTPSFGMPSQYTTPFVNDVVTGVIYDLAWDKFGLDIEQSNNGAIKVNIPGLPKVHDTYNINPYGDLSNGHTTFGNNPDTKIRIDHEQQIPTGLENPYKKW